MRQVPAVPPGAADVRRLDRRRFLRTAGAAATLAVAGELLGRRLDAPVPAPLPLPAALGIGQACAIPTARGEVLAVRLDADTVVAYARRCPHLGCPVLWAAARDRFECPCHRAAFDARTGRVLFGPPRRGLTRVGLWTPARAGGPP